MTAPATAATGLGALRDLRARRKRNRLGELEWFEAAYRVYLAAIFGGGAVLWLSDAVGDTPVSAAQAAYVVRHGPALLGLAVGLAFCAGLRSGSQGGPLALEAADVAHVMLAPIDRRRALLRPAVQRIRGAAFAGAGLGALFGQLAGKRLPGSALAWCASGALFGLNAALLWAGAALVAHALRLRLVVATAIAVVGLTWQTFALLAHIPGPANLDGSLALWGERQRPLDLVALVVTAGLVGIGISLLGRTSLDALARRSSLVAQLRFAVTMQDLRTVILLRRQLTHERTRRRPWLRLRRSGGGSVVWRRGWHSLLRFPSGRLVRMLFFAVAAGASQTGAFHGSTPLVAVTGVLVFVLGLEAMEPLSQEVDQPDRTDSFPVERGELLARHLVAPFVVLVPFAVVGGVAALIVHALAGGSGPGRGGGLAVTAVLALPTVLAGGAGAAINIVRDAPDPLSSTNQQTFVPPEMAGFSTVLRTLIPLVVSTAGALPVLAVRAAVDDGSASPIATAGRSALAVLLLVGAVVGWVRVRDRVRRKLRAFMAEGRASMHQQRPA